MAAIRCKKVHGWHGLKHALGSVRAAAKRGNALPREKRALELGAVGLEGVVSGCSSMTALVFGEAERRTLPWFSPVGAD